ncbi:aminopeptidase N [Neiella marina]|uniref:Aminopeptidase N n=1 Tax=Neiella holothuriorum TaxID=2870530 RepID=A0ABS7ED83_9GAMM|nr:aminopeptidase N [Neiella holothuriorum]MBW8190273.1 aminopeptidase N [Neiella holothuriorum]
MTAKAKLLSDYRTPEYTIDQIALTIELKPNATKVTSRMRVARQGEHQNSLILDGEQLKLIAVSIDGCLLTSDQYSVTDTHLEISAVPANFELVTEVEIDPAGNTSLEGLYLSDGAFCTQCEAEGFRKITYYLDRPDVLARFTTTIIADANEYPHMLSNGNEIARETLADSRTAVTWQDPFPKPCYLFALVAGNFDVLEDTFTTMSGRSVALQLFVDKGNLDRADYAMVSLKNSMAWDEKVYGLEYDLDIYMIVAVDFFNMGAMENKGLNVFNSKYVLANQTSATDQDFNGIESVIGHEYFHNWTGNRVTCRDWFQLSLKEGLTVFRDQCFSEDMTGSSVNRIDDVAIIRSHQFSEDAGPMAHPIRPKSVIEMNNFYTVTVYNKGAEVIRMMHTLLGAAGFRKGMDLYFARHDGQAVTCDDFVQAMEDANDYDLGCFRVWYQQAGTPTVTVNDHFDPNTGEYVLELSQQTPATADEASKQATHIPLRIGLYSESGEALSLDTDAELTDGNVYSLVNDQATLIFRGLSTKPTPVLLKGYSAPIKLEFDYSNAQLITLMQHCEDGFSRWDAAQTLFARYIWRLADGETETLPDELIAAVIAVSKDKSIEPALKARLLQLPAVSSLLNQRDKIAIMPLLDAIETAHCQLADSLAGICTDLYESLRQADYQLNAQAAAKRALSATCLDWIAQSKPPVASELSLQLYNSSNNMTEQLNALKVANRHDLPIRQQLMDAFESRWSHDGLVMDKWLTLQGCWNSSVCTDNLAVVEQSQVFSLENPNRARSLISGFAAMNHRYFHAEDGRGYQWLADKIKKLNSINPQIAARLINPLTQWRRFEAPQGELMKQCLQGIYQLDNLSKDLQEIIGKSLDH